MLNIKTWREEHVVNNSDNFNDNKQYSVTNTLCQALTQV